MELVQAQVHSMARVQVLERNMVPVREQVHNMAQACKHFEQLGIQPLFHVASGSSSFRKDRDRPTQASSELRFL